MLTNNGIWLVSILLKRHATTTENQIWVVLIHAYTVYLVCDWMFTRMEQIILKRNVKR